MLSSKGRMMCTWVGCRVGVLQKRISRPQKPVEPGYYASTHATQI